MSPSTLKMSSTKKFSGHFRSSPSSAQPVSNQQSSIGNRRLASRPRVSVRGTRTHKLQIPSKDGQSVNETPSEPHHTARSHQAQSPSDDVRGSDPLVPSDSEEAGEIPDTPQPQPHNNGIYSSAFTPHVTASTHNTLWDVTRTVVSPHEQKLGRIYVYRDLNSKDAVYKIGMTTRPTHERVDEHERCCKSEPVCVYDSNREIKNCKRLEALIGWDLGYDRMRLSCSNRVHGHEEWFAVSKESAIETVKQWEQFMDREQPYNAQGNLSIIWRYLLRNRSPKAADIRKLCAQTRRQQWAAILASPTYQDYAYAYLSHAGSEYRRFRGWRPESYWKLSTVIYGLWTLALSRNVVAFYALIVVLGCASNTLIPESDAIARLKKRRGSSPKKDTPNKA